MKYMAIILLLASMTLHAQNRTTIRPKDTGTALVNPGMGWVFHHYDNDIVRYGSKLEPWDTVDEFPGVGVIYLRLAWSYLEPEEGHFNWSVVDIPAQRWIAKGKKIAFRFTTYESAGNNPPNATPEWVAKAGAKVYPLRGGPRYEPDYDDPIFLAKLDNFFTAAARRYDGDPNVAWIDIGTVGIWGEGDPGPERFVTAGTVRKHIDLHTRHFRRTLIAYNDNLTFRGKGLETINYAKEKGLTLRDDSILCRPGQEAVYTHYYAGAFWPRLPVILESEHYGLSVQRGDWGDGSDFLRALELAHGSYVSVHWWPREFLAANKSLVDRFNLRLGYRLQLLEAALPEEAPAAGRMVLSYGWRNNGVAPCLPGGFVAFTLKDQKGGIAGVFVDESFDVRSLAVGEPDKAEPAQRTREFLLPPASVLRPGTYRVFVSVGSRIGTPEIALPLEGEDGAKRYAIGTIRVTEPSGRSLPSGSVVAGGTPAAQPPAANPWDVMFEQPLVKWALEIGDAKSLPWGNPAYDTERAPEDALALLVPGAPVLARMETMRRVIAYSEQKPAIAYRMLAALEGRAREADAAGKPDPLAWFDLGHFYEACRQAKWLSPEFLGDRNGYSLVMQAIRVAGDSAPDALEMQFAAGLILLEPKGQHPYYPHFKTVVKQVKEGSLLEKNLLLHLSKTFEANTLEQMRKSRYLVR